ncbi:2'-5' RNA ligase family protein [Brachybacterium hainanense]|uniref:2'-5' RNA ligase family protein n=1 Tax=Brachybacterium hainanense TaxID=1541174 RepID=A0ABV6RCT4_9MICO
MPPSLPWTETALLIPVPHVDPIVGEHRRALDPAAADGIPAHVTALYPFIPLERITARDHAELEHVIGAVPTIPISDARTAWFGDQVLYLELDRPGPVHALITRLADAFPDAPPFAGRIAVEDIVPHVTIGQDRPLEELERAAHDVETQLPWSQVLDRVELWAGPPVAGRTAPAAWSVQQSYSLGR